jgi:hypothetical protein
LNEQKFSPLTRGLPAAIACFVFAVPAMAAMPIASDDTGILDPGAWEFSVFVAGEKRESIESYEAPAVEAEYGVSENLSVAVEAARQVLDEPNDSTASGWGNGTVAMKWRFYNQAGKALALVPSYTHPLSQSSKFRGLVDNLSIFSLPLVGSIESGDWIFTAQVSYDLTSDSFNGIGYGFWTGYNATDSVLLLAEVYGEEISGDDNSGGASNWRLGLEWGVSDTAAILLSGGSRIQSDLPADQKLDAEFFVGFRWETS